MLFVKMNIDILLEREYNVSTIITQGELNMPKIYYIAKPEYADAIYGDQLPICIDLAEVKRLAKEWDMTTEELLEQMNEASDSAIEEHGVYNG